MTGGQWEIRLDGHAWTESSLSVPEAKAIAELAGRGWESLDPLAGPGPCAAVVAVLAASRLGEDLADAVAAVEAMKAHELLALVHPAAADAGG